MESQIVLAIKQVDTGPRIQKVRRKMGISEATFYNWKKKYGGLGVSELRRLKSLKEENAQLKKLVADLSLYKQILQDVLKKSSEAIPKVRNGRKYKDGVQHLHPALLQACIVAQECFLLQGQGP